MRIRKRKVPLPLSLLSPVPLSDPHLFSRSPVMVHHHHLADHSGLTSSSSHTPAPDLLHAKEKLKLFHLGFGEGERKQETSNDSSNATAATIGAPAASQNDDNVPPVDPPVSNDEDLKSWSDKERVVPLKKRKANFQQSISSTNVVVEPESGSTTTLATDKSCSSSKVGKDYANLSVIGVSHDNNNSSNNNSSNNNGNNNATTKKGAGSKRGNTIMEGSRCSRVNGRGWRCCQPTLVGYSLCEHHLGKGRMRSMTSVRGRPVASKKAPPPPPPTPRVGETAVAKKTDENEIDQDEVVKPMTGSVSSIGKRVKLGVVKARSLSSLLGQTTNVASDGHIGVDVNNIHQQEASINVHDESNGMVKEEA